MASSLSLGYKKDKNIPSLCTMVEDSKQTRESCIHLLSPGFLFHLVTNTHLQLDNKKKSSGTTKNKITTTTTSLPSPPQQQENTRRKKTTTLSVWPLHFWSRDWCPLSGIFIGFQCSRFYFCKMNTCLQVKHPITECITKVDFVECQFHITGGEVL